MKLIWYLADPGSFVGYNPAVSNLLADYPEEAQSCHCTTNAQLEHALIAMLAKLPATLGYYPVDDSQLAMSSPSALATWAARVRGDDPNAYHLTMIAHWGIGDTNDANFAQYAGIGSTDANEWYPVMGYAPLDSFDLNNEATMAAESNQIDAARGQLSTFFLQSFSWGDSLSDGISTGVCTTADTPASCAARLPFPTASEMTELRNAVIGAGAPWLITWYRWTALMGAASGGDPVTQRIGQAGLTQRLTAFAHAVQASAPSGVPGGSGGGTLHGPAGDPDPTDHFADPDGRHRRRSHRQHGSEQDHRRCGSSWPAGRRRSPATGCRREVRKIVRPARQVSRGAPKQISR